MKKAASALVLAGALTFVGAGAATAFEYPAQPTATVSDSLVAPGATVTFSGEGFTPGEIIDVTVTYSNDPNVVAGTGVNGLIILMQQVGAFTTTAGADGKFSVPVTLGSEAGTYTLTATGRTSGNSVSNTVVVDPKLAAPAGASSAADPAGLADTGADSTMLLWGAAGALALGAGVVSITVARRKKTA